MKCLRNVGENIVGWGSNLYEQYYVREGTWPKMAM